MQLAILASHMMLGETDDTEISLTVIVQLLGNAVSDFGIAHVARRFKAVVLPCNICRNLKILCYPQHHLATSVEI